MGDFRIVLLASGVLGAHLLKGLLTSRCQVVAVVPWQANDCMSETSAKQQRLSIIAKNHGIAEFAFSSANSSEFVTYLRQAQPDCVLLGCWGELLSEQVLTAADTLLVNCHPALLPRHRGPNPYASAIRNGERHSGVSFHLLDKGIDSGPVLLQRSLPIAPEDTGATLRARCAALAQCMVTPLLNLLSSPTSAPAIAQNALENASYFPAPQPGDGLIDWRWDAQTIHNNIRGLNPWVDSYTYMVSALGYQRLRSQSAVIRKQRRQIIEPGTIVSIEGQTVWVASGAGDYQIGLQELRFDGPDRFPKRLLKPGACFCAGFE